MSNRSVSSEGGRPTDDAKSSGHHVPADIAFVRSMARRAGLRLNETELVVLQDAWRLLAAMTEKIPKRQDRHEEFSGVFMPPRGQRR
jgi:hypothetical protein